MKADMTAAPMRSLILCAAAALTLSSSIPTAAHTALTEWHIATDGDDAWPGTQSMPFQTIARGIEAAAIGDTVLIHDGVYTGPGNRDLDPESKQLTIRSVSGNPEACIIDAESDSSGTGWIFAWDQRFGLALVDGVTLRNARSGGIRPAWLDGPNVSNCVFENCGTGLEYSAAWFSVRNSRFVGCGRGIFAWDLVVTIEDCVFTGNIFGLDGYTDASFWVLRSEFYDNGTACHSSRAWFNIASSVIRDNSGEGIDGWIANLSMRDSDVVNNGGAGLSVWNCYGFRISGSTVSGNGGAGIEYEAEMDAGSFAVIENSTIAGNGGGGFLVTQTVPPTTIDVSNTLIAFNAGEGLADFGATYINCVVYGNGADDLPDSWQPGTAGNFAKDPLFCDAAAGDYGLAANSPCAPSALHDLIGAHGVACAGIPAPVLLSVADVPNDQGGQVRLTWYRSGHDEAGSAYPIRSYDVYRRLEAKAAAVGRDPAGKLLGWDYLLRVPARGDQGYQVVAPTLCDSTITDGLCESVFMVTAVTADPLTFFDSSPDSGWSTDDLAPGAPAAVTAAYQQDAVALDWADAPEADFQVFRIYRATDPDFVPTPEALVHQTGASSWSDPMPNPWGVYYKVTAVDFAGNEGAAGAPGAVSAVGDQPAAARTALLGAAPNPLNPSTTLSFDLAAPGHARLQVYNAAGRLVATLVDEQRGVGRHEVIWNGRDDGGRAVASGVYLYRLEAVAYTKTMRMVLIK